MPTFTSEEFDLQPGRLLDDAKRDTFDVVTVGGEPVMLTLALGQSAGSSAERLELAISLYERDVMSLGLAAKVAGAVRTDDRRIGPAPDPRGALRRRGPRSRVGLCSQPCW